jgi:hypothetical protein
MSDDIFGQLCFYAFVDVPSLQFHNGVGDYSHSTKPKRVRLATVYCKRSESATYFLEFKSANAMLFKRVVAEFSFTEAL